MKSIALGILILGCVSSFAADGTNIIVATDWSEPVDYRDHSIRGRLLIVGGNEPAYGGPKADNLTMMFVELEHVTQASGCSVKMYFDVMGLKCDLVDSNGKPAPQPQGFGYSGRGPFGPEWIVLPYNSSIRLYLNVGSKSPLDICQGGRPGIYWSIPSSNTNAYYLSGTLSISVPTNSTFTVTPPEVMGYHSYADWKGMLIFPKVKISASEVGKQK